MPSATEVTRHENTQDAKLSESSDHIVRKTFGAVPSLRVGGHLVGGKSSDFIVQRRPLRGETKRGVVDCGTHVVNGLRRGWDDSILTSSTSPVFFRYRLAGEKSARARAAINLPEQQILVSPPRPHRRECLLPLGQKKSATDQGSVSDSTLSRQPTMIQSGSQVFVELAPSNECGMTEPSSSRRTERRSRGERFNDRRTMSAPNTRSQIDRLYHTDYYLRDCEGHTEFRRTHGQKLSRRLAKCLVLTRARPGELWVDLGCGRGEIARHLAARGARVIGVDPSHAAIQIASDVRVDKAMNGSTPDLAGGEPGFVRAVGEHLPIRDDVVDGIVLSDVVEHLKSVELDQLLLESKRVLRPGGRLVIHTQPNRWLVQVTVPLLSRVSCLWGVDLPRDLREEMTAGSSPDYHPNEQSLRGLRRALWRAGLLPVESWLEGSYALHRIFGDCRMKAPLLGAFRRSAILKTLFATQVFAVALKTPHRSRPTLGAYASETTYRRCESTGSR